MESYGGDRYLVFSDPVWSPDSKCVGIAFKFTASFPNWKNAPISVETVEQAFEGNVHWISPEKAEIPYYVFETDIDLQLKVFTNSDGTRLLSDKLVVLQESTADDFVLPHAEIEDEALPAESRRGAQWEPVNEYANLINRPKAEILSCIGEYTITEGIYAPEYVDDDTGIIYQFNADMCSSIKIPAALLFPELNGSDEDGASFLKRMALPADWGYSDGTGRYQYTYWCPARCSHGESEETTAAHQ
jgi:hypothetical protein